MKWITEYIHKEVWSPYVAGILLGIVGILAVLLSNSLLGASGAFESLAGMIGKSIAPKAFDTLYFNFVMPPGINWGIILLVGVFFGGMVGAWTSGTLKWGKKDSANSDAQWKKIFGPQTWKRWVLAFVGSNYPGICSRHRRGLHERPGDFRWNVAGPGSLHLHCRDVRFRYRYGADRVPEPVLEKES